MRSKTFICLLGIFNFSIGIERPIKVIITSYNNESYCEKNLKAVFNQKYSNYKVYYCNDASTDNTLNLVKNYIKTNHLEDKCILIANNKRQGKMANFHYIMSLCDENDIVVIYDGDDWFAHDRVLERINEEYEDSNVWATYGSYEDSPNFYNPLSYTAQLFISTIKGSYRKSEVYEVCKVTPGHPFTFYAWLYKKIKEEDFKYKGEFVSMAPDGAILWPIIEMAGFHLRFIPDLLYIYNYNNPSSESRTNPQLQWAIINFLIAKPVYNKLDLNFLNYKILNDVFLITNNLSDSLNDIINNFKKDKKSNNIGQIFIYFDDENNEKLLQFKNLHPDCLFLDYSKFKNYDISMSFDSLKQLAITRFDINKEKLIGLKAVLVANFALGPSDVCYFLDARNFSNNCVKVEKSVILRSLNI